MKSGSGYIALFKAILFAAIFLSSCEDVINVKLKNTAPRLVVEGSISNISDSVIIYISKSTDYYTPSNIVKVNDALVSVTDSSGNRYNLQNLLNGVYTASGIRAQPGEKFSLQIGQGGTTYTGSAVMPALVKIDTVIIDKEPDRPDEDRLNILINDPPGERNFYRLQVFRNNVLLDGNDHFILFSDKYFDGKATYLMIGARRVGITMFDRGDRIKVRLFSIEKSMYDYFDVLRSITDELQFISASAPSNPPNNLDSDALGYFAAWEISEKTVIKF